MQAKLRKKIKGRNEVGREKKSSGLLKQRKVK